MPFLFSLCLLALRPCAASAAPSPADEFPASASTAFSYAGAESATERAADLRPLSDNETLTTTQSGVNRRPGIVHEPIIDEESSAIAREELSALKTVLDHEAEGADSTSE